MLKIQNKVDYRISLGLHILKAHRGMPIYRSHLEQYSIWNGLTKKLSFQCYKDIEILVIFLSLSFGICLWNCNCSKTKLFDLLVSSKAVKIFVLQKVAAWIFFKLNYLEAFEDLGVLYFEYEHYIIILCFKIQLSSKSRFMLPFYMNLWQLKKIIV